MRNKMKGGVRLENSQKSSLIASKSKMAARVAILDQDAILKYFQLFLMSAHIVIGFCIPQNPKTPKPQNPMDACRNKCLNIKRQ